MNKATLTIEIPPAGESPHLFRLAFLCAIRDAIATAQLAGEIDAPVGEGCFRALPTEEPRR